jgi:flagellar L-ring protein precursor FlgH
MAMVFGVSASGAFVWGQGPRSSLVRQDLPADEAPPLNLEEWSFYYNPPPPPPRQLRKYDLVTIRVNELERMESEGTLQRRRNASLDLRLQNWLQLFGLDTVKPAEFPDGEPRIRGNSDQIFRTQGELETSKRLDFNIAATVVDVRPNQTLVLEAHRQIMIENEVWEYSLSGVCRAEDIGPDNIILSRNISELMIQKRERGHIRDSYKRGAFTRLLDRFNPF